MPPALPVMPKTGRWSPHAPAPRQAAPPVAGPDPWVVPVGIGLGLSLLSGFVLPAAMPWFLAAIPHEMGHATMGCLLGHPSAPAISLRGEAWTGIAEQRPFLVWLLAAAALATALVLRRRGANARRWLTLLLAVPLLPLCAFTALAEVLIAAAGHLGELLFTGFAFFLAASGGYTGRVRERMGSALAGGLVLGRNLELCWGLLTSAEARALYGENGSLGLTNDYLRLSEDSFGCSLQAVALVMLLVALLPLPLGLWLGRRQAAQASPPR